MPEGAGLRAVADGRLAARGRRRAGRAGAAADREEDGEDAPVGTFPPAWPNPVLLYFLETTVRAMAEATGGSPFYIRNRIREALAAAGSALEGEPRRGGARRRSRPIRTGRGWAPSPTWRSGCASSRTGRGGSSNFRRIPPGRRGYHERLVLIAED